MQAEETRSELKLQRVFHPAWACTLGCLLALPLAVSAAMDLGGNFWKFDHFCYYAHVGQVGDRGAWGAIEFTGQPLGEAHKYRALVEHSQTDATQKP